MFHSVLVLADRLHRANFLARDRDIHDGMIGTVLVTFAATDAGIMVDLRLPVLFETDRIFRAVHIAASSHTSTAKVRNLIVHLHTGRTGFIHHAHQVLFLVFRTQQCLFGVFRQRCQFVDLILHIESEQRQCLVFPHSPLLVHTATADDFRLTRTQLDRQPVYLFEQTVLLPKFH